MKILTKSKKTGKEKVFFVRSKKELKDFIKKVSTLDLNNKTYSFEATKEGIEWFKELYKKKFYNINQDKGIITINTLPNGIRRSKVYKKKLNSDRTFKNTIKRIEKTLKSAFEDEKLILHTKKVREEKSTGEQILIQRNPNGTLSKETAIVFFDKEKWTYNFAFLESYRVEEFFKIIKDTFEKHTASTRNYRKKRANKIK